MERIFQIITVFALVIAASNTFAQEKAKIVFDELEHDFGDFKETDGDQTATFKFTNTGEAPLVLNNVTASCGCTTPQWTKEPVAPGSTGEIKVSYNPKNRPGSFTKSVTVRSNADKPTVILRIKGCVVQRERTLAELYPRNVGTLRVKSNHISFSRIKNNETATKEMELVNDTDNPLEVGFRTVPGHLDAKVEPENIPAHSKGKLIVTYDAKKANTYGFTSNRIYLSIDGSNDYKSSIGVSATIEEDFSGLTPEQLENAPVATFTEKTFDFGEMAQGDKETHTFTLQNSGKSDLIIRNVRSSCGCTAVAPAKNVIPAGDSAPVKVTFNSRGKRGRQSKTITVITNDPKRPTTTLRISCNVVVPSKS